MSFARSTYQRRSSHHRALSVPISERNLDGVVFRNEGFQGPTLKYVYLYSTMSSIEASSRLLVGRPHPYCSSTPSSLYTIASWSGFGLSTISNKQSGRAACTSEYHYRVVSSLSTRLSIFSHQSQILITDFRCPTEPPAQWRNQRLPLHQSNPPPRIARQRRTGKCIGDRAQVCRKILKHFLAQV